MIVAVKDKLVTIVINLPKRAVTPVCEYEKLLNPLICYSNFIISLKALTFLNDLMLFFCSLKTTP